MDFFTQLPHHPRTKKLEQNTKEMLLEWTYMGSFFNLFFQFIQSFIQYWNIIMKDNLNLGLL